STVPNCFSTRSKASSMAPRSVTSASTAKALAPDFISSAENAASRSARRATNATAAPLSAKARANCWPRPDDAPVTSATRPFKLNISAALVMALPLPSIKRMRQRGRKGRDEPQHHKRKQLNQHERNDAHINVPRRDLRGRHRAQEEQGRSERRVHVRSLQVHRH